MEISSGITNREPAAPMAAGRQASETIDRNNTMGSAQSKTSACVKYQPRRTLPAEPMGTFMSELSFFRVRPSLGRCKIPYAPTVPYPGTGSKNVAFASKQREFPRFLSEATVRDPGDLLAGLERIAPVGWSPATRGGANRSTWITLVGGAA
jgi:hypothetical protein